MVTILRELGPLRAYSCRPLERTIGTFSRLTRSKTNPGANIGNVLVRLAALDHVERVQPSMIERPTYNDNAFLSMTREAGSPQLWLPMHTLALSTMIDPICDIHPRDLNRVLKNFWLRAGYGTQEPDDCVLIGGRLWKDSTVFRSTLSQGADPKRTNSCVRITVKFDSR